MHRHSRLHGVLQTYIRVDGAVGKRRSKSWSRAQLPRPSSNRTSGLQHDPPVRRSRYNSQFQSCLFFSSVIPPSSAHALFQTQQRSSSSSAFVSRQLFPTKRQPSHHGPKIAQITTPTACPKWPVDELPPVPLRSSASYDGRAPTNDSRRRPPRPCWADGARRNGGKRKKISWIK